MQVFTLDTTNSICDDLVVGARRDTAQIVGTAATFDSAHLYDSSLADAEQYATGQRHVFLFGVLFCVRSGTVRLNVLGLFEHSFR